jgi:salicylate hydroxylase
LRDRAIHRGDYQAVLLDEALSLGAVILTNAEVVNMQDHRPSWQQLVTLRDGRQLSADLVIGADGVSK